MKRLIKAKIKELQSLITHHDCELYLTGWCMCDAARVELEKLKKRLEGYDHITSG